MLSRVADNLYWMSRYLERAEHTARLVDVQINLSLDQAQGQSTARRWERLLHSLHVPPPPQGIRDDYQMTHMLTFDSAHRASVVGCIAAARENARQVRERISTEMWLQLNRLYLDVQRSNIDLIWSSQPHEFFQMVKNGAHTFQGITDSTMSHDQGWQFIQIGRFIERAMAVATLVDRHFADGALTPDHVISMHDYFEWLALLKSFTAFEAYCKVYNADLRSNRIVEFLLLNPHFPHALRFCVEMIHTALQAVAELTGTSKNSRVHRLAGRLRSTLSFDQADEILTQGIHTYLADIERQCAYIHDALYEAHITYPVEATLA